MIHNQNIVRKCVAIFDCNMAVETLVELYFLDYNKSLLFKSLLFKSLLL